MQDVVFVAVGVLALIAAAVQWNRVRTFIARATSVNARIVRLEGRIPGQPPGRDGQIQPRDIVVPVLAFTDEAGTSHTLRARMGMRYEGVQGRREIPVFYDPARPESIWLSPTAEQGQAILLLVMGVVVLALGVAGILR